MAWCICMKFECRPERVPWSLSFPTCSVKDDAWNCGRQGTCNGEHRKHCGLCLTYHGFLRCWDWGNACEVSGFILHWDIKRPLPAELKRDTFYWQENLGPFAHFYLHLLEMKGISFESFIPRISFISWRFLVLTEWISAISGQSAKHIQSRDRYCYDKHGKIRWLMQLDNLQLKNSAGQKIIPKIHLIYNLLPIKKQPMNKNLENFHENPRPPWKGHCISPNPRCVASYFPEALSRTIGRRPRLPQPQWHPTSPRLRLAKGWPTPGMANNGERKKNL